MRWAPVLAFSKIYRYFFKLNFKEVFKNRWTGVHKYAMHSLPYAYLALSPMDSSAGKNDADYFLADNEQGFFKKLT